MVTSDINNNTYILKDLRPNNIIGFMINDICNLKCPYCYQNKNMYNGLTASKEVLVRLVNFIEYSFNRRSEFDNLISVEGGEPFMTVDTLDFFLGEFSKLDVKYNKIMILSNMLKTENIAYILEKYKHLKIVITPSFHYTVIDKKQMTVTLRNIIRFKDNIDYIRLLLDYNTPKLSPKLSLVSTMLTREGFPINFAPFIDAVEVKKFTNDGFGFKSDGIIIINGEEFDCNEIYKTKYKTKGLQCETDTLFFYLDGRVETHNCIGSKTPVNINDSNETLYNVNRTITCHLDYCTECEFTKRYPKDTNE